MLLASIIFAGKHALELVFNHFTPRSRICVMFWGLSTTSWQLHVPSAESSCGPDSLKIPGLAVWNQLTHVCNRNTNSLEQGMEKGRHSGSQYVSSKFKPMHSLPFSCRPSLYVQPHSHPSHPGIHQMQAQSMNPHEEANPHVYQQPMLSYGASNNDCCRRSHSNFHCPKPVLP